VSGFFFDDDGPTLVGRVQFVSHFTHLNESCHFFFFFDDDGPTLVGRVEFFLYLPTRSKNTKRNCSSYQV